MPASTLKLDADDPADVASGIRPDTSTFIEAKVGAPQGPASLLLFNGVAIVNLDLEEGDDGDVIPTQDVAIILEKNLQDPTRFLGSTSFVTLAAIGTDETLESSFDVVDARTMVRSDGALRLNVTLAAGSSANLLRISYQSFVLVGDA